MTDLIPLGEVSKSLEEIGYEVTYAYNDLVFIEHSPFILRFDLEDVRTVHFYAHNSFDETEKNKYFSDVNDKLNKSSFKIIMSGTFELMESRKEDNNIDVIFYENNGKK
ncbi:MAG: hypothetical protein JW982_05935 [Spirochaetes bacterium]|nr:hypothetical protein [Spirochaetota bacterium]